MKILVACEYSGRVRDAFCVLGHDAISCDLLSTETEGPHHMGDVTELLHMGWDLMVAHPPCTHLAVSGARWFKEKQTEQAEALEFVRLLMNAPIEHIAIENPISIISSRIRKPDQIIQPWQFGHGETKATCLWLKGLPKLQPTNIVEGREQRVHKMPPSPDRWRERSRTFAGIAWAMALQWGSLDFPTPRVPDVWESTPLQAFSHPETFATSQALSTPPTRGLRKPFGGAALPVSTRGLVRRTGRAMTLRCSAL